MNRDDILRMAREAKLPDPMVFYASIERFAALVAAVEREACARIADAELAMFGPGAPVTQYQSGIFTAAEHIAETIRARGDK